MRRSLGLLAGIVCVACGPGESSADTVGGADGSQADTGTETGTETGTDTDTDTGTDTGTDTDTDGSEADTESTDDGPPIDLPQGPPCEGPDVIEDDLGLHSYSDLQAIEGVRCITGALTISDQLEPVPDLAPLWALEVIGGVFQVGTPETTVDSLVGLDSLTWIGGLRVERAPLTNLAGLDNLESIGTGGLVLHSSTSIANLDGLAGLASIEGDLRVQNVEELGGLASLTHIGGELWLTHNPELAELDALASVVEFDGRLVVGINDELVDIGGLANLPGATEVHVLSNPKLSTCAVLDLIAGLEPLEHRFVAGNDDMLCQPAEPCATMDAHADGPCDALVGVIWFGQSCGYESGCNCVGKDCVAVELWSWGPELCDAAFAGCP